MAGTVGQAVPVDRPGARDRTLDDRGGEQARDRRRGSGPAQHRGLQRRRAGHVRPERRLDGLGVRGASPGRAGEHRLGGQPGADQGRADALALKGVYQSRGVSCQQHVTGGRRGAGAAHAQPPAHDRPRPGVAAQIATLAEQRDQPGQISPQQRVPAACSEADPDAHVRLAVLAGKQPAVPGVDAPRAGVEQDQQRQRNLRRHIRADREAPQRRLRVEHPSQPGDRAQRPVRGDDDLPRQALPVAGDHGIHPAVPARLDRGDAGSYRDRAGLYGGLAQRVVQREPRHDDPVTGVGAPGEGRQPAPPAGRADHEKVRALPGVGDTQPQIRQDLYSPGPHQVPACLVTREGRLVGQRHPRTGPGQHQRGDAAGRPGADHHHIEATAHRAERSMTSTTAILHRDGHRG